MRRCRVSSVLAALMLSTWKRCRLFASPSKKALVLHELWSDVHSAFEDEVGFGVGLRSRGHHRFPLCSRRHRVSSDVQSYALAARGETPRCTEIGSAPGWQGATREQIGAFVTEELSGSADYHADPPAVAPPDGTGSKLGNLRPQRQSNAAGLLPRAAKATPRIRTGLRAAGTRTAAECRGRRRSPRRRQGQTAPPGPCPRPDTGRDWLGRDSNSRLALQLGRRCRDS